MGKNLKAAAPRARSGTATAFTSNRNLAIVYRTSSSLKPDPKNPRLHSEKQVQQIARSIEAFGFNVPLLIDAEMQVVAGHGRLQACQLLGIMEVPTISLEHLTEPQARAFMIADNRLTENATWDDRLLAQQFKDLSEVELDFSLEATGFEMGEIDVMVENLAPATEGEDDPADAVPEPVTGSQVSKCGDMWQLGRHKAVRRA
jgi:ParB-like chromosome segregation protein Spo0J